MLREGDQEKQDQDGFGESMGMGREIGDAQARET